MYLFLDTETTGFKKSGNIIQDKQARVCQLAMILTDENGKSLMEYSSLIKPDNWKVSQYNIDTCGITQHNCEKYGTQYVQALGIYKHMAKRASLIVAHNDEFDRSMMEIEGHYHAHSERREYKPIETPWFCTMRSNVHITGGKWPKLEEALRILCNRSLGNKAHNAKHDAEACRDIFFASKR